jgi:uncharacterized protein (TIGR00369 family)
VVSRRGDSLTAEHTFHPAHAGAPGIAHGGVVATAFDDLFGCMMWLLGEFAVTRSLSVEFLKPVRIGTSYRLIATPGARSGRRVPAEARMMDPDGRIVASAAAAVVITDADAFMADP